MPGRQAQSPAVLDVALHNQVLSDHLCQVLHKQSLLECTWMLGMLSRPAPGTKTTKKLEPSSGETNAKTNKQTNTCTNLFVTVSLYRLYHKKHQRLASLLHVTIFTTQTFSVNKIHSWFNLLGCCPEWQGHWFQMVWRHLPPSHTQGLRSPKGRKVVHSFQTLGASSLVTQCNNPKDLHRWHQRFRNLSSCKVYVHSTKIFGKFSGTQMSSGFDNLNSNCKMDCVSYWNHKCAHYNHVPETAIVSVSFKYEQYNCHHNRTQKIKKWLISEFIHSFAYMLLLWWHGTDMLWRCNSCKTETHR